MSGGLYTSLNRWGVDVICWLQKYPLLDEQWLDTFWLLLTKFGDPKMVFTLYVPAMYAFRKRTAHEFLLAGAVSEFLNMVFKWILMSDRPYWWIHEPGAYTNETRPKLVQFELTCETGPGSPSGHAMVTSCVWLVFLLNFRKHSRPVKAAGWVLYTVSLLFIALSRLYVAAHFPHQLILGVACGVTVALLVVRYAREVDLRECSILSGALLASALITYFTVHQLGVDPNWTIEKARRWCANPNWIHVSTMPLTGLFRDLGALMGLGLAADLRRKYEMGKRHVTNIWQRLKWAGINVVTAMLSSNLVMKLGHYSMYAYYAATFGQSAAVVVVVMFLAPYYLLTPSIHAERRQDHEHDD